MVFESGATIHRVADATSKLLEKQERATSKLLEKQERGAAGR